MGGGGDWTPGQGSCWQNHSSWLKTPQATARPGSRRRPDVGLAQEGCSAHHTCSGHSVPLGAFPRASGEKRVSGKTKPTFLEPPELDGEEPMSTLWEEGRKGRGRRWAWLVGPQTVSTL